MDFTITWFGRCCFLIDLNAKKILFDPYDTYCNVDIGIINADILISSSTWHDHGHIGSSPKALIISYPGTEKVGDFVITGIEAKENRGTPTIVFNLQYKNISITNFADLGAKEDRQFNSSLTEENRAVLKSTNIAFIRPSIEGSEIGKVNLHNEKALNYCSPQIIFPEHYFPESFINEKVHPKKKADFLKPNIIVDEMIKELPYKLVNINGFSLKLNTQNLLKEKIIYKFSHLHPQVEYI